MERKLATALFVDLVDSTALVASSDPEVARRRVTGFFEGVKAQIDAYGGTVEKFAGDAVLAVFGVPTAHEDDAERAVRAALAIVEHGDGDLPVRIGIEAGELVVEDGDSTFATGEAINVAARQLRASTTTSIHASWSARATTSSTTARRASGSSGSHVTSTHVASAIVSARGSPRRRASATAVPA